MQPQWKVLTGIDNTGKVDEESKSRKKTAMSSPLVASAPSTKCRTVTSDIQLTISNCIKRSNSYAESKYKCVITSERLNQLKKQVDTAFRENRIFTIKGGWTVIRQQLLKRNWLEKIEPKNPTDPPANPPSSNNSNNSSTIGHNSLICTPLKYRNFLTNNEELISNLPVKQDWESPSAYIEKCEKTILNRLLQRVEANFFWSLRRDQCDMKQRANPSKLINRFSRSLFASKEGLALLLQNYYWYTEQDVAAVNFPRCFVLGFPEHFNHFVDNFRMTACISLLKQVCQVYDATKDKFDLESPAGKVPVSTFKFALERCTEYVASQKHVDIDKDFGRVLDADWKVFLSNYYLVVHSHEMFKQEEHNSLTPMIFTAKGILKDVAKYWTEFETDGVKNIWILKPGNKCRGRGIILVRYLKEVEKIMNLKLKYVVQKYIEKPLIIYNTKFDIRQWFLVTSAHPLTIWMYKECYLRFSSQNYNLDNFHESLHLTNHAVQCKYTNMEKRDNSLPKDNMWDSCIFREYLKKIGKADKWESVVFPGMKQSIVCAMLASQDTMDRRQNTFEMYGADFILSEDLCPWLLEINCSPDMSSSTSITKRMCPQFLSDIIKVVIDRRRDPKADVGLFQLIYKQVLPRAPPYLGTNLAIRGRKMLKNRCLRLRMQTKPEKEKENKLLFQRKQSLVRAELLRKTTLLQKLPKVVQNDVYKGPVIEDLIDELHKCCQDVENSTRDRFDLGIVKKSASKDRVPKRDLLSKYSINVNSSNRSTITRRNRPNESFNKSIKKNLKLSGNHGIYPSYTDYRGRNNSLSHDMWEKNTASILTGRKFFT